MREHNVFCVLSHGFFSIIGGKHKRPICETLAAQGLQNWHKKRKPANPCAARVSGFCKNTYMSTRIMLIFCVSLLPTLSAALDEWHLCSAHTLCFCVLCQNCARKNDFHRLRISHPVRQELAKPVRYRESTGTPYTAFDAETLG